MGLSIERTDVYSAYANKLHSIEEELHAQPITEELREQIIHELDEVNEGLSQLQTTAAQVNRFSQSFLDELRQKAVFLYGEVDDFYYKHEVEVIQHETVTLAQTLQQKDIAGISKIIDSLKGHINLLLESYSPALQDRRVLVFAKTLLEQAEALLQGKMPLEIELSDEALLETEGIIEEIAEYLGNNDRGGFRLLWNRLTADQKRLVRHYLDPKDLFTGLLHEVERPAYDKMRGG